MTCTDFMIYMSTHKLPDLHIFLFVLHTFTFLAFRSNKSSTSQTFPSLMKETSTISEGYLMGFSGSAKLILCNTIIS